VYFGSFGNTSEIWRIHLDATGLERLTGSNRDGDPDPSPDGAQIVFFRHRTGTTFELMIRDLSTGTERSLSVDGVRPRWSPRGNEIAYWNGDPFSEKGSVYVIGINGSGARKVSATGRNYRSQGLDWSPDGEWLVARSDSSVDLIQESGGLTLPLGYSTNYQQASWRR
jgi:Tol biopolymer transport system component